MSISWPLSLGPHPPAPAMGKLSDEEKMGVKAGMVVAGILTTLPCATSSRRAVSANSRRSARLGRHLVLDSRLPLGDAHVRLLPHAPVFNGATAHLQRHPRARLRPQGRALRRRCSGAREDDQGPHGRAEGRRGGVVQRRRSQEDELTSVFTPSPSAALLGHTSNDRHHDPFASR